MATKQVEVTPEAAQRLGEPIEKAKRETEMLWRVNDLEYSLNKTRDALRVISRSLEDLANNHAGEDELTITQDEVSMLYGTVSLLDYVADECGRAFRGEA